jgi:hypothetical protein
MSTTGQRAAADAATALEIAVEAYTFLYPLVLMDLTRQQMTNAARAGEHLGHAPADAFAHIPAFPPPGFKDVVRPNFDTLYSSVWLDLHEEPRIISVPAAGENYYLLPMLDMWTDVFACPGTRTTGGDALEFAVCPPAWSGALPDGIRRYESPTRGAWMIGRTEASPETYERVHAFQAGLTVTPLSEWGGAARERVGSVDPSLDPAPPMFQVDHMDAAAFFSRAAGLLQHHAPHRQDSPMLDRMEQLGFRRGEAFDLADADPIARKALEQAVPQAQQAIRGAVPTFGTTVNGWHVNTNVMGAYGVWYLKRAAVAFAGLGANLADDAIYPIVYTDAHGEPFTGTRRYVWHMTPDELPPVNAFWSLTMYDPDGFGVANELDRCAIGDRDALEFNADGSLDILIQHDRPDGTANWLPAPPASFNLCARLYWPKPQALDGTWAPPAVRRVR